MFFGRRTVRWPLGSGSFYCPKCKAPFPYEHIRPERDSYVGFLFWASHRSTPLHGEEYVECGGCGTHFEPTILRRDIQEILRLVSQVDSVLRGGMPFDAARDWLIKLCGSAEVADRALQIAC